MRGAGTKWRRRATARAANTDVLRMFVVGGCQLDAQIARHRVMVETGPVSVIKCGRSPKRRRDLARPRAPSTQRSEGPPARQRLQPYFEPCCVDSCCGWVGPRSLLQSPWAAEWAGKCRPGGCPSRARGGGGRALEDGKVPVNGGSRAFACGSQRGMEVGKMLEACSSLTLGSTSE